MATTTNSEPEAPAEPRKRRQRQSRVSYADLFGRLQAKTAFARTILHEAAEENEPAVVKRLVGIALKTLQDEP